MCVWYQAWPHAVLESEVVLDFQGAFSAQTYFSLIQCFSLSKCYKQFVLAMMVSIISSQSGGTALFYAGWEGHSEVVKLLLGAGARDIPNKVNHWLTMICRKSVPHEPQGEHIHTSVCQTYFKKESYPGWDLNQLTLCSLVVGQLSRQCLTKLFFWWTLPTYAHCF